jgi:sulfur-oxidizing protein SoxX
MDHSPGETVSGSKNVLLSRPFVRAGNAQQGGIFAHVRHVVTLGVFAGIFTLSALYNAAHSDERLVPYRIVNGSIPTPLTAHPGDPERGRRIVLDRNKGDCVVCHAMPLADRQFHGTVGPPLDGVGSRYTAGALRLRLVDPKVLNPNTAMPAYYKVAGLYRVLERYRGQPILTAQEIEDVVAYLLTLK